MKNRAAKRDSVNEPSGARAKAEIDVFATVDKGFIEAAEPLPEVAADQDAGAGYSDYFGMREREDLGKDGAVAEMFGLGLMIDDDASVIEAASSDGALKIADQAGT